MIQLEIRDSDTHSSSFILLHRDVLSLLGNCKPDKDSGKGEHSFIAGGSTTTIEIRQFLGNLEINLCKILSMYPRDSTSYYRNIFSSMFITDLLIRARIGSSLGDRRQMNEHWKCGTLTQWP